MSFVGCALPLLSEKGEKGYATFIDSNYFSNAEPVFHTFQKNIPDQKIAKIEIENSIEENIRNIKHSKALNFTYTFPISLMLGSIATYKLIKPEYQPQAWPYVIGGAVLLTALYSPFYVSDLKNYLKLNRKQSSLNKNKKNWEKLNKPFKTEENIGLEMLADKIFNNSEVKIRDISENAWKHQIKSGIKKISQSPDLVGTDKECLKTYRELSQTLTNPYYRFGEYEGSFAGVFKF